MFVCCAEILWEQWEVTFENSKRKRQLMNSNCNCVFLCLNRNPQILAELERRISQELTSSDTAVMYKLSFALLGLIMLVIATTEGKGGQKGAPSWLRNFKDHYVWKNFTWCLHSHNKHGREELSRIRRGAMKEWGLCALRHGIQISMEAILACHPARSTEWLDCHPKTCELWRIRTGPIVLGKCQQIFII